MSGTAYLHYCPPAAAGHDDGLFFLEDNAPHGFGGRAEFADERAFLQIPDLDAPVAASADDAGVVELQAGDAVVVRRQSVDGLVGCQAPDAHGAV